MSKSKQLKIEIEFVFEDEELARDAFATWMRQNRAESAIETPKGCSRASMVEVIKETLTTFCTGVLVHHQQSQTKPTSMNSAARKLRAIKGKQKSN